MTSSSNRPEQVRRHPWRRFSLLGTGIPQTKWTGVVVISPESRPMAPVPPSLVANKRSALFITQSKHLVAILFSRVNLSHEHFNTSTIYPTVLLCTFPVHIENWTEGTWRQRTECLVIYQKSRSIVKYITWKLFTLD